jgi:hypothetical protein
MRPIDEVFAALARSSFRRRFQMGAKEQAYVVAKGLGTIEDHACRIVHERLGAAHPKNDGKQTPMRGHPVFIAQHATATCCRGCLAKWHGIPAGRALTEAEEAHAVAAIMRWVAQQEIGKPAGSSPGETPSETSELQLKLDLK